MSDKPIRINPRWIHVPDEETAEKARAIFPDAEVYVYEGHKEREMGEEFCMVCDEPTGRAGFGDDSLYDERSRGPYCPGCFETRERILPNRSSSPVAPPAESEVDREVAQARGCLDAFLSDMRSLLLDPSEAADRFKTFYRLSSRLLAILDAERQARAEAERREALLRLTLAEWRDRWERTIRDQDVIRSENDALRERCDQAEAAVKPCSDHNCVLGHPGGMGTNGGCQHLKMDRAEMRQAMMAQMREMRALRERCAEMEQRFRDAVWRLRDQGMDHAANLVEMEASCARQEARSDER